MKLIGKCRTKQRGEHKEQAWDSEACTALVLYGGADAPFKSSFFEYVWPLDECELRNAIVKQSRQELDLGDRIKL